MNIETLNKANMLMKDVKYIEEQLEEVKNYHHYIIVSTPDLQNCCYSYRFQTELKEWLKAKKEEYQKEFDELM